MAIFKFRNFVFDSERYRLEQNGKLVDMRPKALRLLCLLIENRDRVVSKSEIFTYVWGNAYARDHLLFQLVSELRKAPFEAEFVRTQPNQGYRWNVATRLSSPDKTYRLTQVAASLVFALVFAVGSYFALEHKKPMAGSALLPAHSAFSKGVIAMHKGDSLQAIKWFEFALRENPESIESSLFLAEALLRQDRYVESSERLHALLSDPSLSAYNTMTANDLLSQVHQRQGSLNTALKYALQSSQQMSVAQCSVETVEGRVDALSSQMGFSHEPKQTIASEPEVSEDNVVAEGDFYSDQCDQLRQELPDTSFCSPKFGEELFVNRRRASHPFLS